MDAPRNADASRDVLHVPTEMLEMILLAADWDWHLAMSLVCRRWRDVLAAWRGRAPLGVVRKLQTPMVVAALTVPLATWARACGCPWDERTCYFAAEGGHLEILQWARENGCPWDSDTCGSAEATDNEEVLEWAIANGCPTY